MPKNDIKKNVEDFKEEVKTLGKKLENKINESTGQEGPKKLYRSGKDKILGGVCGGVAEYLNTDPVIIRLIWVVLTLMWGVGLIAYLIAWIIIPRNPAHEWNAANPRR